MSLALLLGLAVLAQVSAHVSAHAEQRLIPTPYPSGADGARLLAAPPSSRHQVLIPTPYPRNLGPNALGNPRITKTRRHQKLVPTPYRRQYR